MHSDISKFIAEKLRRSTSGGFSGAVYRVAVWSVGLGLAIMLISVSILGGFRETIQNKIFSLSAHLTVSRYDRNNSFDDLPLETDESFAEALPTVDNIHSVQAFARKSALLKSQEELSGILFKGITETYDSIQIQSILKSGRLLNWQAKDSLPLLEILLSKRIANRLLVEAGDSVIIFFVQEPPRIRKVLVCGLLETGLDEFDEFMVLGDLDLVRQINGWQASQVGGYELFLKDFNQINASTDLVFEAMEYNMEVEKVTDQYVQLFDWLELLKRNVVIFVALISFVAVFNVASSLLVMVMERTAMIGILKAMGANDRQIGKIFFLNGAQIIIKGLAIGNLIALVLLLLQYFFQFIPLDPENYYMESVPVRFEWWIWIMMNVALSAIILAVLWVPIWFIGKIRPILSIRFD